MTVVSIHQPSYFPWLGLIDKIARSDIFVILDNVQFNHNAYQHRTLYSTIEGERLLTLPVCKGRSGPKICDLTLADSRAPRKHLEILRNRYRKSLGWPALVNRIEETLLSSTTKIADLSTATINLTLEAFGINRQVLLASELGCCGAKDDLNISIIKAVKADTYLSGSGAKAYQSDEAFSRAGIHLLYQEFNHPTYSQSHGGPFIPGCFALEWLIEEGPSARELFCQHLRNTGGGDWPVEIKS